MAISSTVRTTKEHWGLSRDKGKFLRAITVSTAKTELRKEQALGRFPKNPRDYTTWVDRNPRKPIQSVKFGGSIAYLQKIQLSEVYEYIFLELARLSPYGESKRSRGARFRRRHYDESHVMLVDGRAVIREGKDASIVAIKNATKYIGPKSKVQFVNIQPYARRIERGYLGGPDLYKRKITRGARKGQTGFKKVNWTMQAPNGVYKVVAKRAARRFRGVARIQFTYAQLPALGYSFTDKGKKIGQFYPVIVVRSDAAGITRP